MRYIFAILALAGLATGMCAAPPAMDDTASAEVVRRIDLPEGDVKWENVKTKDGIVLRVTAGKTVIEGKQLFYGDGTAAMEVVATPEGMEFLRASATGASEMGGRSLSVRKGFLIDGYLIDRPGGSWELEPSYLQADEFKPGSVYLVPKGIKFQYQPKPKAKSK